jgi:hypothetical protein
MPAKKKPQSRVQKSSEVGFDHILDNQEDADFIYVTRCLNERPRLRAVVASLLRDGEIDRALMRRDSKAIAMQLGKPLTTRMKKLKNLAPRLWTQLFNHLNNIEGDATFEPEGADPISHLEKMQFCCFALNSMPDTDVPKQHPCSEWEGPMLAVLKARCAEVGPRLDSLTYHNKDSFGWATYSNEKPTKVTIQWHAGGPLVVDLPYTEGFMQGCTVTIQDNCSLQDCYLCDENAGFSQVIWPLLQKQHPKHGLQQDCSAFELPDAAADFKEIVAPSPRMLHASMGKLGSNDGSVVASSPGALPGSPAPALPTSVTPPAKRGRDG